MAEKNADNFRGIIRISNTDIDGNRKLADAIRKVKGIGFSFANALCSLSKLDRKVQVGYLSDAEIKKIEDTIANAHKEMPKWLLNRRRGYESDNSVHMVTTDLTFANENDVRTMQKIKSYRGVRHMAGAPVRGQRTRSNFRRNKGKVQGVSKSKSAKASAKA